MVAFESKKLNLTEQRYSTYEKKMVEIDNMTYTYFKTQNKLSSKQARWQEFLIEYDFVWEHKVGIFRLLMSLVERK